MNKEDKILDTATEFVCVGMKKPTKEELEEKDPRVAKAKKLIEENKVCPK